MAAAMNWPSDLYAAAAVRPLATAIHVAACRAEGKTPRRFADLETHQKRTYDELAIAVLRGLRPTEYFGLAAGLARAQRDKVCGAITPREPWGVEPDARD